MDCSDCWYQATANLIFLRSGSVRRSNAGILPAWMRFQPKMLQTWMVLACTLYHSNSPTVRQTWHNMTDYWLLQIAAAAAFLPAGSCQSKIWDHTVDGPTWPHCQTRTAGSFLEHCHCFHWHFQSELLVVPESAFHLGFHSMLASMGAMVPALVLALVPEMVLLLPSAFSVHIESGVQASATWCPARSFSPSAKSSHSFRWTSGGASMRPPRQLAHLLRVLPTRWAHCRSRQRSARQRQTHVESLG